MHNALTVRPHYFLLKFYFNSWKNKITSENFQHRVSLYKLDSLIGSTEICSVPIAYAIDSKDYIFSISLFRWRERATEMGFEGSYSFRCSKRLGVPSWWGRFPCHPHHAMLESFINNCMHLSLQAVPPVIHRDIKSSNILLDQSMRARVCPY